MTEPHETMFLRDGDKRCAAQPAKGRKMTTFDTERTVREKVWWAIHNLIAHPVSEILYWLWLEPVGNWIHDATVPANHEHGRG